MRVFAKAALGAVLASACIAAAPVYAQMPAAPHGSHASLNCTVCHADQKAMKAPSQKVCLQCHVSYDALAKKTAGDKFNPHDSHMGRVECTACHSVHNKSRFICRDCHAIADRKFKGE